MGTWGEDIMIYLTNIDGNVKLGFDFLNNLPKDFDNAKSKFEKWVPFVLNLSTVEKTVAISEAMQAQMTIFEVEKIYNGLKNLLSDMGDKEGRHLTHYSSESFFEVSFEYLLEDECFEVEIWFIVAEYLESKIQGYDMGFRFIVGKSEMEKFTKELYINFEKVCPQCSLYWMKTGLELIDELKNDPEKFCKERGKATKLLEEYYDGLSMETLRELLCSQNIFIKEVAL